ncbi:MAG TPA: cytochrome c [Candidatus Methylomirabilis sp.]|nr:cytochrome c [Candidatus Methylomirabilis sp.]
MTQRHVKAAVVLGSLATLVVGGFATAPNTTADMSPSEIVADRQRLMKLNGASWLDAQAKLKAGNIEGIAVNAETMALNARQIPALFPPGSLTADSKAKPEIWQKWSEFEADAKNLQVLAEKLRDAAKSKDAAATEAIMKDFGREACGSCHTPFRVPPPRS